MNQLRDLQVSRAIMQQFLTGQPISEELFHKICQTLELNWEDVAEPPDDGLPESEPLENGKVSLPENPLWLELRYQLGRQVVEEHQFLPLLNQELISLETLQFEVYLLKGLPRDIYVNLGSYLEQFDQRQEFERFGLGERQERLPALQIVQRYKRLLLLGRPASGKSTLLRRLAVACAKGDAFIHHIPVLINLRHYSPEVLEQPNALETIIQKILDLHDLELTQTLLEKGHFLILIDDLDRIPTQARRNIQFQLRIFAQRYYQNRFIAACRTQITDYTFPTFRKIELAPLNKVQIETFIQHWFQEAEANSPVETTGLAQQLMAELQFPKNQRFSHWASRPMILHLLCWIFQYLGHLPKSQFSLYELGITRILEVWQPSPMPEQDDVPPESTIYAELNLSERYRLLSYIAVQTFENKEIFFNLKKAKQYIGTYLKSLPSFTTGRKTLAQYSALVLAEIEEQHGLIFERSEGLYTFESISVHEFLIGHYLLKNFDPNNLYRTLEAPIPRPWYKLFSGLTQEMEHINDFLLHVKHKIDQIVAKDKKVQIFLSWINQKSILVKVPYSITAVRAFYFSQAIDHLFDPRISNPIDFSHAVNRALRSSLHDWSLACMLDRDLDYAFNHNVIEELHIEFIVDLILNCLLVTLAHDLKLFMTYAEDRRLKIDPELKDVLQRLKQEIPSRSSPSYEKWWQEHCQTWTKKLRLIIIEHRNIGYDWQFNQDQRALLRQYYNANKLLVECISNMRVQPQTVKEIEETLLLPTME
ncbi:MAG: NACHT domain-containing protein, partial [Spirulinaceae cyanobacterium]